MKKLALNVEDLVVASFETSRTPRERGTVHGNDATHGNSCADTCPYSCADTCDISCVPSCISTCDMALCGPVLTDAC
jgi:hypothetical protein